MFLRDTEGSGFDSTEIQTVLDRFDDPRFGAICTVRLSDQTVRTVRLSELRLAEIDDQEHTAFFDHLRMPPSMG